MPFAAPYNPQPAYPYFYVVPLLTSYATIQLMKHGTTLRPPIRIPKSGITQIPSRRQASRGLFSVFSFLFSTLSILIGSPVIRIRPKPFRISHNFSSNRHKTPSFVPPRPRSGLPLLATRHSPLATPLLIATSAIRTCLPPQPARTPDLLIGSPVIRIRLKPFRISAVFDSNRLKRSDS